jgi:hypothetical protein
MLHHVAVDQESEVCGLSCSRDHALIPGMPSGPPYILSAAALKGLRRISSQGEGHERLAA